EYLEVTRILPAEAHRYAACRAVIRRDQVDPAAARVLHEAAALDDETLRRCTEAQLDGEPLAAPQGRRRRAVEIEIDRERVVDGFRVDPLHGDRVGLALELDLSR